MVLHHNKTSKLEQNSAMTELWMKNLFIDLELGGEYHHDEESN